jgi:hypothetical protein
MKEQRSYPVFGSMLFLGRQFKMFFVLNRRHHGVKSSVADPNPKESQSFCCVRIQTKNIRIRMHTGIRIWITEMLNHKIIGNDQR